MSDAASAPTISDLRAQRDALERQVAAATIAPCEAYMALLASDEISQFLARLEAAVETLDDATVRRVAQWVGARDAMVKLGNIELARLRRLLDEEAA